MAEYTANAIQTVAVNQDILFTDDPVRGNNSIMHREGSGLVTLRGITCQCKARFRIFFGANIAVPEGGTAGAISASIAISGEAIPTSSMTVTPAAVNEYFNVSASLFIDVPAGCCTNISVKNTSEQAINVQKENIIVERVA